MSESGSRLMWRPEWDLESRWKAILENKDKAVAYASMALEDSKKIFKDVSDNINQVKNGMNKMVDRIRGAKSLFEQYQVDPQAIIERLTDAGSDAVENLQKEFEKPFPGDMNESAKYRAEMVAGILNRMEQPYITVCVDLGIPEDRARDSFQSIRCGLEDMLIVAGMLECCTELWPSLTYAGVRKHRGQASCAHRNHRRHLESRHRFSLRVLIRFIPFSPTSLLPLEKRCCCLY